MSRPWKIALILLVILLLAFSISLAWSAPQSNDTKLPTFSAKDRQLVEANYARDTQGRYFAVAVNTQ